MTNPNPPSPPPPTSLLPGRKQLHRPHRKRINFQPDPDNTRCLEAIRHGLDALLAIDRHRCLTSWQLARLLLLHEPSRGRLSKGASVPARAEVARTPAAARSAINQTCLRPLKDLGLVEVVRVFREQKSLIDGHLSTNPIEVNILSAQGQKVLREYWEGLGQTERVRSGRKSRNVANQIQNHLLAVNDVAVALIGECAVRDTPVVSWLDDAQIKELRTARRLGNLPFEPDGLAVIQSGTTLVPLIVEVDLGTESIDSDAPNSWTSKMTRYQTYFRTGYPTDPLFAGMTRPIVLTATTVPARLGRLLEATANVGGKQAYWATCLDWFAPADIAETRNLTDAIWRITGVDGFASMADHIDRRRTERAP